MLTFSNKLFGFCSRPQILDVQFFFVDLYPHPPPTHPTKKFYLVKQVVIQKAWTVRTAPQVNQGNRQDSPRSKFRDDHPTFQSFDVPKNV